MKSIGEQVTAFREARGWNTTRMAREAKTTRQSIEHLESRPGLLPRYVDRLARVMGTSVDDLMAGRFDPNAVPRPAEPAPRDSEAPAGLTPEALQLAYLFDRLPRDIVLRAKAWNAATSAILALLMPLPLDAAPTPTERTTHTSQSPSATADEEKGRA